MGSDFIEKAAPTFRKSWDRARVKLATANLFTQKVDCAARTSTAEILQGVAPPVTGEILVVEAMAGVLIARRGNTDVARFTNPAPAIVEAVNASCGIAMGTVEQVYPIAKVADISLC